MKRYSVNVARMGRWEDGFELASKKDAKKWARKWAREEKEADASYPADERWNREIFIWDSKRAREVRF